MARPIARLVPPLVVLGLAAGACTGEAQDDPLTDAQSEGRTTGSGVPDEGQGQGTLTWSPCGPAECSELEVPVDHDDPGGPTLTLSIARVPASGDRIGPLFVNPGGPGATATDFAVAQAGLLPAEITERFDVVGVDPRGLGASDIDCGGDITELYGVDHTIDDPGDRRALLAVSGDYVDGCEAAAGDLLPHLGTVDAARDIDAVRAAMGDDRLSYLGFSYGTAIGQVLLDRFPERVRAMVLDGILELGPSGIELAVSQARGFERSIDSFAADCDDDPSCALAPDAAGALDELIARVESEPIPASPRALGPGELFTGLVMPLYSEMLWPQLARAVDDALDGDGTRMVALADRYLSVADFDVYFAVNCIDFAWPDDPDELLAAGARAADVAPRLGESIVNDYVRCPLWPVEAEPLEPVDGAGGPPVVVVSTTNDPATPHEAGVAVADRLVDGRLLTYEGDGHTVVGNGVPCVDGAVTRYLVDGQPPEDGTVC
ncbi:MAG: alpha/beta hydrolase [Acidimicrobiia bacterium]